MKFNLKSVLAAGLFTLATVATATGNLVVRFNQVVEALQPAGDIKVERIELASDTATGYRKFTARGSNVIAPGTPFNIYFEPTNLVTKFENGAVRASMTVDIEVRNSAGEVVGQQAGAWKLPLSVQSTTNARLKDVYASLALTHLNFAEGSYKVLIRVHDDFGGKSTEATLDIELRRQSPLATVATEAAQRLTR